MEDLLAQEQTAEQNVKQYLDPNHSIESLLHALKAYRELCEACVLANITSAERHEVRLWSAHTEARKFLHHVLSRFRKAGPEKAVATREVTRGYLKFIKEAQAFYRGYIQKLNARFGGISELQQIAHRVLQQGDDGTLGAESSAETRQLILQSCHRTLIYLGDLSRYRASGKLDKKPDFGPAVGYYQLACAMWPISGMGHHQQAVVALEQRKHFRAIYHLYRALIAKEPHPNALTNLKLEFDKVNDAWERGTLIHKGAPNDPDAPKRTVCGWFVRLHSLCYPGEVVRGYEELETQLLTHLKAFVCHESCRDIFARMIMVNMAAQTHAGDSFQRDPTPVHQQAFLYFFRANLQMLTMLADAFYSSITAPEMLSNFDGESELSSRLDVHAHRLLPCLRMYSSWLVSTVHLIAGLASEEFLTKTINDLWTAYARMLDIIATLFPIWDLEDVDEVDYLLEEDVECSEFRPLAHERTTKIWVDPLSGKPRRRYSDEGVERISADEEMLVRVRDILSSGLQLATDSDASPISLQGTRIVYGDKVFQLPAALIPAETEQPTSASADGAPKLRSYAAAAAAASMKLAPRVDANDAVQVMQARQAQLSRMVDDLVQDDDLSDPVTPPQVISFTNNAATDRNASSGRVVPPQEPMRTVQHRNNQQGSPQPNRYSSTSHGRAPSSPAMPTSYGPRLQSVSALWHQPGATGTATNAANRHSPNSGSPARTPGRGHSRGDSASSIRSSTSQHIAGPWSSKGNPTSFGLPLASTKLQEATRP